MRLFGHLILGAWSALQLAAPIMPTEGPGRHALRRQDELAQARDRAAGWNEGQPETRQQRRARERQEAKRLRR